MDEKEYVSMRIAYGKALVELGHANPDVVVLSADVSNSDHSYMFEQEFSDRFYNVGIAEQSLVDVATGLALTGKIPFANTFAFLFATRALEMVRTHLCYGGANVKLMGAYAGLSDSFDGPTHHSITDIAIMRSLPGMTIVVPSDTVSLAKLLPQVADYNGPVFVRLNRNEVPLLYTDNHEPLLGKGHIAKDGDDLTLVSCGLMVNRCLEVASRLEEEQGLNISVIDMHTIKPLDEELLLEMARRTGAIVTVEEHSIIGGLGGAVAELLAEKLPVPMKRLGLKDCFAETGPYNDLLDKYGMSVEDIVHASMEVIKKKKS
jgi:transketolase